MTPPLSQAQLDAMRLEPLDRERYAWHREHMTPAKWRALEAVRDGRVVVRSIPDPSGAKYGMPHARYCVPETVHGRRVARGALIEMWSACWGWGRQIEKHVFEAFLRPVGFALLATREHPTTDIEGAGTDG